MSLITSYTYLGGYGPVASVTTPADPKERATELDPLNRDAISFAYPQIGFGKAPAASDDVWWAMRRYSACVLAYAVTVGPVFAGTRTATIRNADDAAPVTPTGLGVQVTETPEEKRRKLVEDVFEDQWPDILNGLECYNFGRWLQEMIWGRAYGVTAPVRFKSFLPGDVQLLRDKFNDFAGFQTYGSAGDTGKRGAPYAFLSVCQPHFDPIFGVPRAENAREPWWRAVQSHENGDRIERKASGIQMYLGLPTGMSWRDSTGAAVSSASAVQTIVNAAASGATFTIPTFWSKDDIKNKPELAGIDPVKIQQFDWGQTGPSLLAAIARLDRLDKEIFRAWHRPEREAMEGEHGTKAEAGIHGQVGIIDSEKVHGDFLRQFNKQVVDRFLVTNFGPDAAGSIYFKPTPLVDAQQSFKQDIVKAMLASPTEGPTTAAQVDKRRLLKETETPILPEGAVVEPPPMPEEQPGGQDQQDGGGNDELALSADRKMDFAEINRKLTEYVERHSQLATA